MEQHVSFCRTDDGVRIAYATIGEGPALIEMPPWVGHLGVEWRDPQARAFYEGLGSRLQVVRFDKRGTGLSERDVSDLSIESRIRDLSAVVEALELQEFALMGVSESGPTALTYAARFPERVNRLIVYGSYHRWPYPPGSTDPIRDVIRAHWGMGSAALSAMFVPSGTPDEIAQFTELQRASCSAETASTISGVNNGLDVSDLLGQVTAPTLVLHRRDDPMCPVAIALEMASLIPGAHFEELEGDVHPPHLGDSGAIVSAVHRFLGVSSAAQPLRYQRSSGPLTVLFTDIVGHTEMMSRLGDERGRDVLREHERITREMLKQHGGAEVKTMGDGFMASFGSVTKAVDCAIALQRAFAAHTESMPEPLHVRVGLNAGEPIEEEGDLFGATVILASRIAAKAGAGEILIPEPVRHLLSGKSFVFSDRGEFAMKGFDDAVRLYEVRWRD